MSILIFFFLATFIIDWGMVRKSSVTMRSILSMGQWRKTAFSPKLELSAIRITFAEEFTISDIIIPSSAELHIAPYSSIASAVITTASALYFSIYEITAGPNVYRFSELNCPPNK